MNSCVWITIGVVVSLSASAVSGCSEPLQRTDAGRQEVATDGGAGSGAGGAPDGTVATPEPWLGRSCNDDVDCGGELRCLKSTEDYEGGKGAPAGGLCTLDCERDEDCHAIEGTAVCATLSEAPLDRTFASSPVPRLCLLGCSLGSPGGSAKCHGRSDLACRPFAPEGVEQCQEDKSCPNGGHCYRDRCREFACGPRCNGDSDCSTGRFCNPQTGLCDAPPVRSVPIGAGCNGDLPNGVRCGDGTCLVLFDSEGVRLKGMCTQSCTLGQMCGTGADTGACAYPRFEDYAAGDIAYCMERCNCDGECSNPADGCRSWESPTLAAHYGSAGFCDILMEGDAPLKCEP